VGPIMSDLTSRRGRVLGSQAVAGGRTMIKAEVPQLEIIRYSIDLRSMSQGTGTFNRAFLRYEPLPTHVAEKLAADSKDA
jgi:elongation factor G